MFNSVLFVRRVCKEQGIPICQLERDCGFSNGYLNPKKMSKLPYDRAVMIADYLDIPVELVLTGQETQPRPPRRPDILDRVDIAFYGEYRELSQDDQEIVRDMVSLMLQRKERREQESYFDSNLK